MGKYRVVIDPWIPPSDRNGWVGSSPTGQDTVRVADMFVGSNSRIALGEVIGSHGLGKTGTYRSVVATAPNGDAYVFVRGKTEDRAVGFAVDVGLSIRESGVRGYPINLDETTLVLGDQVPLIGHDGLHLRQGPNPLRTARLDSAFIELGAPISVAEAVEQQLRGSEIFGRIESTLEGLRPQRPVLDTP